jgi:tRNA modification GTPase
MKKILETVIKYGARPAEPGEFTKRAFLNGRIDLSQAEAVIDIINSRNEYALNTSLHQLKGNLLNQIKDVRKSIIGSIAFIEAALDDPEHINADDYGETLKMQVKSNMDVLNQLLESCDNGRLLKEGIKTVILGKPNAGKSSLMNYLSGEERAIVTDIAGTTRDVLEETVRVGNITLRLADTAGIRENTDDIIEKIGVERAKERFDRASLVLMVLDAQNELSDDDKALLEMCSKKNTVVIINKTDGEVKLSVTELKNHTSAPIVEMSAKNRKGIDELTNAVENVVGTAGFDPSAPLITTERQRNCVMKAAENIREALDGLMMGITLDAINVCIDCAIENLSVLTGEKATETVVNEVFANFCVGK